MMNEELNSDMCNEPVAASRNGVEVIMNVHDDIDDLDWDHYPVFSPKTVEEAVRRVDQAWEDRNDPNKWMSSEQMWNNLYDKYPNLD